MDRTYELLTSIALSYRQSAWGIERIVLDAISNHLPKDSGGTKVNVLLKQGENYRSLGEHDPKSPERYRRNSET